jgi:hypothetical protein
MSLIKKALLTGGLFLTAACFSHSVVHAAENACQVRTAAVVKVVHHAQKTLNAWHVYNQLHGAPKTKPKTEISSLLHYACAPIPITELNVTTLLSEEMLPDLPADVMADTDDSDLDELASNVVAGGPAEGMQTQDQSGSNTSSIPGAPITYFGSGPGYPGSPGGPGGGGSIPPPLSPPPLLPIPEAPSLLFFGTGALFLSVVSRRKWHA